MTIENILKEFAVSFSKKINPEYYFIVQLEFTDILDKNIWQLDIKNKNVVIYDKEIIKPEETFLLTVNTLEKLYNNELSLLTAFLQESNENGIMCSLIDIKINIKRGRNKRHGKRNGISHHYPHATPPSPYQTPRKVIQSSYRGCLTPH